jgi:hypothetical protein
MRGVLGRLGEFLIGKGLSSPSWHVHAQLSHRRGSEGPNGESERALCRADSGRNMVNCMASRMSTELATLW